MTGTHTKPPRQQTLINAGMIKDKSRYLSPAGRVMEYHVISLITRGEGFFTDAYGVTTPVTAGTALYQFAGEWCCFDPSPKQTWTEYWIVFSAILAEERFGCLLPDKPGAYPIDAPMQAQEKWRDLMDVMELRQPGYVEYTEFLVHDILMDLHRQRNQMQFMRMDNDIEQLRQQMRSMIDEPEFSVTRFAQSLHMGYDQLRKRFRTYMGMSPKSYFLQLKINRAQTLLLRPELTVKEIAQQLGFNDPYYFSRLFTRRCGVSPLTFRNGILSRPKT